MDIAQKKDKLIFILTVILVFFMGYNIILKIIQGKMNFLTTQIEEEKNRSEILKTIAVFDRKLLAYQEGSFSTTEITQLMDKISQLAKQADIEIESINPQPTLSRENLVELSVRMPMRCTYHQLVKFLNVIESNRELIWVTQLRIQKDAISGSEERGIYKIDLKLNGLYLKKQEN